MKKIIFYLSLALSIAACDFLEKTPTTMTPELYFNTEAEAKSFLMGVYANLSQSSFYGNAYFYIAGGDDISHWGGGSRTPQSTVICNRVTSANKQLADLWVNLYSGINRANIFLENIDRVENIGAAVKSQYIAEARFMRAYYYFVLVQNWGDVPFRDYSTNTVVGLDLPQTPRQELYDFIVSEMDWAAENGLRTAAEEGYKPSIVTKSAAWGMLARVCLFRAGEHYRGVSLTEAQITEYFAAADGYAQKVLDEGHDLNDLYGDYFIDICSDKYNSHGKNETIWEVEFAGNGLGSVIASGSIGCIIGLGGPDLSNKSYTGAKDPGFGYEFFFTTPKLYDYYKANGDRERYLWNLKAFSYAGTYASNTAKTADYEVNGVTGRAFYNDCFDDYMEIYGDKGYSYGKSTKKGVGDYRTSDYPTYSSDSQMPTEKAKACSKYRREFDPNVNSKGQTAINFPLMRYSDVLLMVAEAENEVNGGPTDLAYSCINKVRTRAGIDELPAGLDRDEFRGKIKEERAMELCFELTRRFDIIRWGEYVESMNEMASLALQGGNTKEWSAGPNYVYTYFQVNDNYLHLPFPDMELSVNKKIHQNKGW